MGNEELKPGSEELKKCPFCGGEACMYGPRYMWIKCLYCGANTMGSYDEKEAIDAWNRRAGED